MGRLKPARLTARLPITPVTEEMREQMLKIAQDEGVSISQVQRAAFSLFLSRFDSKANKSGELSEQNEEKPETSRWPQ